MSGAQHHPGAQHNPKAQFWGALAVVAASILWGTTGTAATFAPAVSPLAIGAVAMGLGGLLQALYATRHIAVQSGALLQRWRLVSLGAAAVAVYPLAFYSSMHLSGVAVGTVVSIGSAPVAAALIERFADRKPLSRQWILGALLGVGGAALLSLAGHAPAGAESAGTASTGSMAAASGPGADQWMSTAGILLGLLAGTTYALYSWAAHRLTSNGLTTRAAMGAVFGLGGLLLMPVLAVTGGPLLESWGNAGVGAYMAAVPMFAGYLLFGWGLARVGASTATSISLLETVVAAVLAVLVVGERLPALGWLGAAVVLASLFILTPRPKRPRQRPESRLRATSQPLPGGLPPGAPGQHSGAQQQAGAQPQQQNP
ncbi:DME family drug/metabolite transporter [Pseudarthrobacter defluvii]|uniref:DMT family transporter n=1 Tax=Pseudarthrobacter defluvii TaxID=410837 RepID=UPI00278AD536|nr:DMT family transporter [Pseudarthrobacter defluvii]MDQ0770930.1 DME family drug/metabolite transporter [Pseudarthrobacter defluvii]